MIFEKMLGISSGPNVSSLLSPITANIIPATSIVNGMGCMIETLGNAGTGGTSFSPPASSNTVGTYFNSTGPLANSGTVAQTGWGTGSVCYDVCIAPDGTSVYAANGSGNALVSQFSRNTTYGNLTALSPATVSSGFCYSISASPDGKNIYAGGTTGNLGIIYQYTRNTTFGNLTALSPNVSTGSGATIFKILVPPDGKHLYASASTSIYEFSRNATFGNITALTQSSTSIGSNVVGLAASTDGNFIYASAGSSVYQYNRNSTTGNLTALSPASVSTGSPTMRHCVVSPDNKYLYAIGYNLGNIYQFSRDTGTGLLTPLIPFAVTINNFSTNGYNIAISPDGLSVFVSNGLDFICQYRRNIYNGLITPSNIVQISVPLAADTGICISPDSKFVYSSDNGSLGKGLVWGFARS